MTRWAVVRLLIVALAFLSVTAAMLSRPGEAFFYWYLYYSPVILAALSFGAAGAIAASAWAALNLAVLFARTMTVTGMAATSAGLASVLLTQSQRAIAGILASPENQVRVGGDAVTWVPMNDLFAHAVLGMVLVTGISVLIGWLVDERRRRAARFERLALLDGLTGVANYRALMDRLRQEIARGKRRGDPCAYLMLDIDGLKAYNDAHGHLAGDAVLRGVASVLRRQVRDIDVVGRYGGDEFGIVLTATDHTGATGVAQRIRDAVALHFEADAGASRLITVSIGIAGYPFHGETVEAVIAAADAALYQTKLAGKDGVTVAAGSR